jgi:hypothetical protein
MEPPSFAGLSAQDIIKDIARLHLRCELLDPVPDFRPKRADLPQLFGCSRIMRRVGYTLPNCAVTVFVGDRPQMLQALNLQLGTALADHVEERRHDFLVPFTNSGGGDTATRRSSSNISSSSESSVRRCFMINSTSIACVGRPIARSRISVAARCPHRGDHARRG